MKVCKPKENFNFAHGHLVHFFFPNTLACRAAICDGAVALDPDTSDLLAGLRLWGLDRGLPKFFWGLVWGSAEGLWGCAKGPGGLYYYYEKMLVEDVKSLAG